MLYYGTVDCTTEVGVLIRDDTGFVADTIIYILTVALVGCGMDPEQRKIDAPEDRLRRGTD